MGKISHIGNLSPNAVLAELQEEIEDIEYVVIVVAKEGGSSIYAMWSKCQIRDVAFAMQVLRRTFDQAVDV